MFSKKHKFYDEDDEPLPIRKEKCQKQNHQNIEMLCSPIDILDSDEENMSGTGESSYNKAVDSTVSRIYFSFSEFIFLRFIILF